MDGTLMNETVVHQMNVIERAVPPNVLLQIGTESFFNWVMIVTFHLINNQSKPIESKRRVSELNIWYSWYNTNKKILGERCFCV